MDKRGFELAISSLILIVLGVLVLIALIVSFTVGWGRFIEIIIGYSGSEVDNLSKLCQSQCDLEKKYSFCCEEKTLGKEGVTCLDNRLYVECNINCEEVCNG